MESAKQIIESYSGRKLRIMEVCGTHTHEIFRLGIRRILPPQIELISGPGCPVCVTPAGYIDEAVMLALEHGAVICTFGDLIRVPGSEMSLAGARSKGAAVKTVYSPLDAVDFARENPDKQVVFLAVGFETTVPAACLAVKKAAAEAHKRVCALEKKFLDPVDQRITAFKNAQRFRAKIQKARDRGIGIDRIIPVYKCHQKDHGLHLGKRAIQFVGEDITLRMSRIGMLSGTGFDAVEDIQRFTHFDPAFFFVFLLRDNTVTDQDIIRPCHKSEGKQHTQRKASCEKAGEG